MNTFGNIFRLTTFGESHGAAIGGVIDGCPSGFEIDLDFIQSELDRRRPGQSDIVSPRREEDRVEILSGIFEGRTTGTPIGFIVRNNDANSSDYEDLRDFWRPSHADFAYDFKYGNRDHRGGGRSSARVTIAQVVAGAIAKILLKDAETTVQAYTSQVGKIVLDKPYTELDLSLTETNPVRCPDPETAARMEEYIRQIKAEGDTTGGVITCVCRGVDYGLGEPVFGKLNAALGAAMLGINAAKGFDIGMGFAGVGNKGSEMNDTFYCPEFGKVRTRTNHSGGIQGGISNAEDIYFRVAFKPVATILREQLTLDMEDRETVFKARGRHDPCVLPRAVPVVEAMAAITLLDYYLLARSIDTSMTGSIRY